MVLAVKSTRDSTLISAVSETLAEELEKYGQNLRWGKSQSRSTWLGSQMLHGRQMFVTTMTQLSGEVSSLEQPAKARNGENVLRRCDGNAADR
jgi:hypothetical protein